MTHFPGRKVARLYRTIRLQAARMERLRTEIIKLKKEAGAVNKSKMHKAVITITETSSDKCNVLIEFSPEISATKYSPRVVLALAALRAIQEEAKRNTEE